MKKLLLFDLDGTLVDSEDFIVWSFLEAGRRLGVEINPGRVRRMIGYPLDSVLNEVLDSASVDLEEFKRVRKGIVEENWRSMVRVFPDVPEVLEYLKRRGYILGVASSSVTSRIKAFLEYFGLKEFFQVVSGVEEGVRGKPEPDVILRAVSTAGVSVSEAVYVGDRDVDCIASRRAGVDFILVERTPEPSDSGCEPVLTVKSLRELTRFF
ncbi:HAD family hydrolase [Thermosphaera chiliense]|uniref:HAD family hydrolase n=1 Tax=Thermosphaera chiliense TaxID=3402707 RepID=A0A7M1UU11_9CREN|nr:HAD family hydrolase [Thermosphaera aggregans]QOR94394.1 HAD family hydrolase [Thermosphaera aggregans]